MAQNSVKKVDGLAQTRFLVRICDGDKGVADASGLDYAPIEDILG